MSIARVFMILTLAFALLPVGCKKDDDSPSSPGTTGIPEALVGTWTLQSATVNGQPTDLAIVFSWVDGSESATIKVEANGAYTYAEYNGAAEMLYTSGGTIAVSGTNFTLTENSENGQAVPAHELFAGTYAVAGNTLTLTIASQFGPVVVTATK